MRILISNLISIGNPPDSFIVYKMFVFSIQSKNLVSFTKNSLKLRIYKTHVRNDTVFCFINVSIAFFSSGQLCKECSRSLNGFIKMVLGI